MLSNLVALLSSRVFVGYPLNRNEAWVRADPRLSYLFIHGEVLRSFGPRLVILWMASQVGLLQVSSQLLQEEAPSAVMAITPEVYWWQRRADGDRS